MCAISSLSSTFAISSPDEFLSCTDVETGCRLKCFYFVLILSVKGNCKCQFTLRLVVLLNNVSYLHRCDRICGLTKT